MTLVENCTVKSEYLEQHGSHDINIMRLISCGDSASDTCTDTVERTNPSRGGGWVDNNVNFIRTRCNMVIELKKVCEMKWKANLSREYRLVYKKYWSLDLNVDKLSCQHFYCNFFAIFSAITLNFRVFFTFSRSVIISLLVSPFLNVCVLSNF